MIKPSVLAVLLTGSCFGTAYVSNATGVNWSQATHWTPNGVPGDGDCPTIATSTVIDTNIGTAGNGLGCNIKVTGGSLTRDSSPHSIYFASTGINPIGSGTASAPANDATMFGFFNNLGGQINLVGAFDGAGLCTNLLTITSGNGTSPWYLFSKHTGSDFKFQCIDASHFGTSSPNFQGLAVSTGFQNFALQIDHNNFTDFFGIKLLGADAAHGAITHNRFSGGRSITSDSNAVGVISGAGFNAGSLSVTDNTIINPVSNTFFLILNNLPSTITFTRNAGQGTSSAGQNLIFAAAGSSGHSVVNNLAVNTKTTSGPNIYVIESASTAAQGNYSEGSYGSAGACNGSTGATFTLNFFSQRDYSWPAQGLIACSAPVSLVASYNVMLYETVEAIIANVGTLLFGTGITSPVYNHNTILAPPAHNGGARGANSEGVGIGEPTASGTGAEFKNNLVAGWVNGLFDDANVAYVNAYAGSGLHHNAWWSNTNNYATPAGNGEANFWDGVNLHPSTVYGEVILSTSPQFVDPTRRVASWDATLGGPGTADHVFSELAKRSGFGGAYNPAYNISDLMTYVMAGFRPLNPSLRSGASDGTTIGAVESGVSAVSRAVVGRVESVGRVQ